MIHEQNLAEQCLAFWQKLYSKDLVLVPGRVFSHENRSNFVSWYYKSKESVWIEFVCYLMNENRIFSFEFSKRDKLRFFWYEIWIILKTNFVRIWIFNELNYTSRMKFGFFLRKAWHFEIHRNFPKFSIYIQILYLDSLKWKFDRIKLSGKFSYLIWDQISFSL